ncbi:MAG: malto-oligosyltrehalose synthase [Acidimicrobiales bacterium]
MQRGRAPGVTYRLQLGPEAGFDVAAALVGHTGALGVTHLYLSPVADAEPGSEHGYDVTDHATVRPELGGEDGLARLATAARAAGMGLVVDIVPNHASIVTPRRNHRWWETLRNGPGHPSARFFDIDWDAQDGRVLLPVLVAPLADELAAGRLTPTTAPGPDGDPQPVLHYGDPSDTAGAGLDLPLAAGTAELPLPELLDAQHYRLMAWHRRPRNLRRFFVIDSLAALRAEDELVVEEINAVPRRLACDGLADGLRVDHVDGLAEPGRYLQRLRKDTGDAWIVVEKILAAGERLPASWPVAGTTGYDFIRLVDHLLLAPGGERPLTELWHDVTGDARPFADLSRQARHEVLAEALAPDLARVAAQARRAWPDADPQRLAEALATLTVETDRYRTYLADDDPDRPLAPGVIEALAGRAGARRPDLTDEIAGLAELFLSPASPAATALVTRWQQLTAPTVAKGDEDRAFYRYHRLTALCEVGGEPGAFGLAPAGFHTENAWRAEHLPASMLAGTTHDTKRSEDVRARLLVLAEVPDRWRAFAREQLDRLDHTAARAATPSDRYLALQTAVGAWPIDAERLTAFLVKAAREASQHTTWTDSDDAYESALAAVADQLTSGPGADAVGRFVAGIDVAGWSNSLAQLVLRLTSPGVPDIYQGTETWHLRLVDPDNRAHPDWPALADQLARAATCDVAGAWAAPGDGRVKTAVLQRVLALRGQRPWCFEPGSVYVPVEPGGARAGHVVAYLRGGPAPGEPEVLAAVTRMPLTLDGDWGDTAIDVPEGRWVDALRSERIVTGGGRRPVGEVFGGLPVAVLARQSA